MFRSIYIKVLCIFLLLWVAQAAIHWAVPAGSASMTVLALTLAVTILGAVIFARSISIRLKKLRLLQEALTRKEAPLHIPDLGDDEIGDFARSLGGMAPELR